MKIFFYRTGLAIAAILTIASFGTAQDKTKTSYAGDKYVISAKAGSVNFVSGETFLLRADGHSSRLLKRDDIQVGERVSTGADGKAEVLLNPGSYIRLGANSEFQFQTTSLDDLKLRVERGSAMFEVFADNDFRVTVETPTGSVTLIESGIYRVDVKDRASTVSVFEGKAQTGDLKPTMIKKGRTVTLGNENVAVAKFDRDNRGELGDWSKARSKELAKMTSSLRNRDVRDTLMSSFIVGRWNMYDSFGVWVYNPFMTGYCFLPFGQGWYSPYGYGFGSSIYWYGLPPYFYAPPIGPRPIRVPPATPTTPTARAGRRDRRLDEPAFRTFERKREPRDVMIDGQNDPGARVRPIYREPTPIVVAPVEVRSIPVQRPGKKDN